ncbi:unnamed protein product [Closterium sp. Naga37s-1]|nr:unnamed protein product [Closterium sp. Naga37s-1]
MSMVAYRIIPDWLDGSLLCARLFLISALPDGTTQLRLLAGRGLEEQHTVELPGVLVWETAERQRFHLQTLLPAARPASRGNAAGLFGSSARLAAPNAAFSSPAPAPSSSAAAAPPPPPAASPAASPAAAASAAAAAAAAAAAPPVSPAAAARLNPLLARYMVNAPSNTSSTLAGAAAAAAAAAGSANVAAAGNATGAADNGEQQQRQEEQRRQQEVGDALLGRQGGGFEGGGFGGGWKRGGDGGMVDEVSGQVRRLPVPKSSYSRVPLTRGDKERERRRGAGKRRAGDVRAGVQGGGDGAGGSFDGVGTGANIGAGGMEADGMKEEVLGAEGGGEGMEGHEGWMMDGDGCAEERGEESRGEGRKGVEGKGGGGTGGAAEEVPAWAYGLEGLWTGEYGPHGVEILNVLVQGGEIVATKITGTLEGGKGGNGRCRCSRGGAFGRAQCDPNVPCGQVTFEARLATAQGPPDPSDLPPADSLLPRGPGGARADPLDKSIVPFVALLSLPGDPNVPCGQVTFKARLTTAQGPSDPSDLPPADFLLPRGPGGMPVSLTPTCDPNVPCGQVTFKARLTTAQGPPDPSDLPPADFLLPRGPGGMPVPLLTLSDPLVPPSFPAGDPNVPCGQVTFKARLTTAQGPPDPSDLPPTDGLLPRGPGGMPVPLTPTRSIVIPRPTNAGDDSAGSGSNTGAGSSRGGGSSDTNGSDTAMGDNDACDDGDCDGGDVDRAAERERERAEEVRREMGERWQRATTLARAVMHTDHDAGADDGTEVQFVWMCQGQGRVADYNFRRPQWVNGCLLVDSAARITFLWQDVHFAIRFRRLDLPKLVHSAA